MNCSFRICLFGGVRIQSNERSGAVRLPHASEALLAYLVLFRQRQHPREALLGQFWGDLSETKARNCLNTALWRLRRTLEPQANGCGDQVIVTTRTGEVGLNLQPGAWVDVAEFEERVSCVLGQPPGSVSPERVTGLEQAIGTYQGELLEGFYDDWALRERERFHLMYLNGLAYLMAHARFTNDLPKSLSYGLMILEDDPLREEIHREVMRLYLESGQRALAARQYDVCRQALQRELGIEPMEETQALYRSIFSTNSLPASGHYEVLAQLRKALQTAEETARGLRQAIRAIEQDNQNDR
jgi:DNA-binding SARP family transcriptional activator